MKSTCKSCETLQKALDQANFNNKLLLAQILDLAKPAQPLVPEAPPEFKQIDPRTLSWNVRRQMLEAEDRKKASILRQAREEEKNIKRAANVPRGETGGVAADISESIADLEKELGLDEDLRNEGA